MINHTYIVIATPVCSVCNHNLWYQSQFIKYPVAALPGAKHLVVWCCGAVQIVRYMFGSYLLPKHNHVFLEGFLHEKTNTLLRDIWWRWWVSSPVCMQPSAARYRWNFNCYAQMSTDTRNYNTRQFSLKWLAKLLPILPPNTTGYRQWNICWL